MSRAGLQIGSGILLATAECEVSAGTLGDQSQKANAVTSIQTLGNSSLSSWFDLHSLSLCPPSLPQLLYLYPTSLMSGGTQRPTPSLSWRPEPGPDTWSLCQEMEPWPTHSNNHLNELEFNILPSANHLPHCYQGWKMPKGQLHRSHPLTETNPNSNKNKKQDMVWKTWRNHGWLLGSWPGQLEASAVKVRAYHIASYTCTRLCLPHMVRLCHVIPSGTDTFHPIPGFSQSQSHSFLQILINIKPWHKAFSNSPAAIKLSDL